MDWYPYRRRLGRLLFSLTLLISLSCGMPSRAQDGVEPADTVNPARLQWDRCQGGESGNLDQTMKTLLLILCVLSGLVQHGRCASVIVQWSTDRPLSGLVAPLSAGSVADGDGTLLQLGYFSEATTASPFAGNWTLLATGTIGDQGGLADGFFSISATLEEGAFVQPAVGTPLGVRFFNGASIASSSL